MSPARSTSTLGMNRLIVVSGLYVAACVMFEFTVPPVTVTW
jgi:hypothetical protein